MKDHQTQIRELIDDELPSLVDIRHQLHQHPELAYVEDKTSALVKSQLEKCAIDYIDGLAITGVLGNIPGEGEEAIALRADMDALPIKEQTGLSYASENDGIMHACGHDGHTAILLGTARVLSRFAENNSLPRDVALVFQPAEEGGAGAKKICDDYLALAEPFCKPIRSIFGLHGHVESSVLEVCSRVGPMLAAVDEVEITIIGEGGHPGLPHSCTDPVVCASAIVQGLQSIISRNIDPCDGAVISITQLKGGEGFAVIPDQVDLLASVRSLEESTRDLLERRIGELAEGIAQGYECRADVVYNRRYPVTNNDERAYEQFKQCATRWLGESRVQTLERPVMGGEDFAFYGEHIPACFFFLGLLPEGVEEIPSLHNAHFDFNDDAIATGIETFCSLALADPDPERVTRNMP